MVSFNYSIEPIASTDNITDSIRRLKGYFLHRAKFNYGIGFEVAEELIQDTYLRMHRAREGGKLIFQRGLPNFLKTVFENLCRDYLKSPKNRVRSIEVRDWTSPCLRTPLDELITREESEEQEMEIR